MVNRTSKFPQRQENRPGEREGRQRRPRLRDHPRYVALRLLAVRARSTEELRTRLRDKGFSREMVDEVVKELIDQRLLNDRDFAKRMGESLLARKPAGEKMLRLKLRQYQLSPALIEETIREILPEDRERQLADSALRARLRLLDQRGIPRHERRDRIARFLFQRGFSPSVVADVLEAHHGDFRTSQ